MSLPKPQSRQYGWLCLILLLGILLHCAIVLPGFRSEDVCAFFSRPDSSGYLAPAQSLPVGRGYADGMAPTMERAPGYPLLLSFLFTLGGLNAYWLPVLFSGLIGVSSAIPVYWAARKRFGIRAGLLAAALYTFHLTAVANRPMFLSDTLFGLTVAWQLFFFWDFCDHRKMRDFYCAVVIAALGALIRPINSAWIWPALFIVMVLPSFPWRQKLLLMSTGALLFGAILFPWMARNASLGGGYCIDTNTGAMYHQNGAMLLAAVRGTSYEAEKQTILEELEKEFSDIRKYPDAASRTAYRLERFRELIRRYPLIWISQHFRPHILLPDLSTFCENMGLTSANRGTLDVLQRHGVLAAVNHYFDGRLWIPGLLIPLLLPIAFLTVGVIRKLWFWLKNLRYHYVELFLVLAFVEYYFFLPGPITVPRYQIPALAMLSVLGGSGLLMLYRTWSHWRQRSEKKRQTALNPDCKNAE